MELSSRFSYEDSCLQRGICCVRGVSQSMALRQLSSNFAEEQRPRLPSQSVRNIPYYAIENHSHLCWLDVGQRNNSLEPTQSIGSSEKYYFLQLCMSSNQAQFRTQTMPAQ